MRRSFLCLNLISLFLLLISAWQIPLWAASGHFKEYEIKAVYLRNLAIFTHWPDDFLEQRKHFTVCVIGKDPFHELLDKALQGETIHNMPAQALRIQNIQDIAQCQLLFVSPSERAQVANILAEAQKHPVLTVSDMRDFVINGGMLEFFNRKNKVRFMLDPQSFREARLKASSHLMRVAKLVH